jgi:uncharacterized membrane protein YhaH (DUF805 family)
MNFESLFVNPKGRTSRASFVPALIVMLAVVAFYALLVGGRTGQFCLLVLVIPGVVLHARRLHDMGYTAWLLVAPAALMITAFAIWLKYASFGARLDSVVPMIALVVAAAFALWGCLGKGQSEANRHGAPLSA